ncbi:MAG: SsrA-binding protein, partial [Patescibacteria group bacterium]
MRQGVSIQNRGVGFHYEILDKFVAGIELKGFEVKSIKIGRGNLSGSYISN